jgi:NAD(P)-dependent dehydrogenase (short-subunit alcohol dehydrogenase family)
LQTKKLNFHKNGEIMMRFQNKVALVTGGASGIGQMTAVRFAREGATVVINDLAADKLQSVAQEINSLPVCGDVSQSKDVNRIVDATLKSYGRLDILVNNAGISHTAPAVELKEEDWDRMIAVHQKGTFLCSQQAARIMIGQRYGKIISLSSKFGFTPAMNRVHYCAAKAAIAGMTRAFALELSTYGINVNAVAPGTIETPMTRPKYSNEEWQFKGSQIPIGRPGQPKDVADLILFLASDDSAFITGQIVHINGGDFMF